LTNYIDLVRIELEHGFRICMLTSYDKHCSYQSYFTATIFLGQGLDVVSQALIPFIFLSLILNLMLWMKIVAATQYFKLCSAEMLASGDNVAGSRQFLNQQLMSWNNKNS